MDSFYFLKKTNYTILTNTVFNFFKNDYALQSN